MKLSKNDQIISERFETAARELGFEFTSPYCVTDKDGTQYWYLGLAHHFGAETGLLIGCDEVPSGNSREDEYSMSLFGPENVESTSDIKQLLIHWGWFGEQNLKPKWI